MRERRLLARLRFREGAVGPRRRQTEQTFDPCWIQAFATVPTIVEVHLAHLAISTHRQCRYPPQN
ncbi:MAG: hypothetical protein ACK55Z_13635, partial [bacterium]